MASRLPTLADRRSSSVTVTADDAGDASAFDTGWSEASRYALVSELARGGGGKIAIAIDRKLGRRVALKRPLDRDGDERLEREARVLARLEHPAIVPIHDAGFDADGAPFYTMKLVAGRDLAGRIAEAGTFEARLALLPVVTTVADAIAYAHGQRVIHRDLKPGNVLVGELGEVAVIDWGLGKLVAAGDASANPIADAQLTRQGAVIGTPAYMAPEQARGDELDERTDVYAIGAMLYQVLAGVLPYGSELDGDATIASIVAGPPPPISEREPRVPKDLAAIVATAMARDPAERYPTARELADDLRRYQTGRLVAAHRYPIWIRVWRWTVRHRTKLAIAMAAVALATTGAVVALAGSAPEPCTDLDAGTDAVWNPGVRAAGERAFLASGAPQAAATWLAVAARLDEQRDAIAVMRTDACRATRVRGEQTEVILTARMECLDRRVSELGVLADTFAHADAGVVGKARVALGALGRVADCADTARLADLQPLPAEPVLRAEVLAIQSELDRLAALDLAGKTDVWMTRAPAVLQRAANAGYGPTYARALVRFAATAVANGNLDNAATVLEEAAAVADRSRDDATRARALVHLARLELTRRERLERAQQLLGLAGAAADRAADVEAQASVYVYRSWLAQRRGDKELAISEAKRAVELASKFEGNELFETERVLAGAYYEAGRAAEAEAAYTRVLTRLRAAYGDDDHAEVARALEGLAGVAYLRQQYDRGIGLQRQAIAIHERTGASLEDRIAAHAYLGVLLAAAGRLDVAAGELEAVLPSCEARLGSKHSECVQIAENLAAIRAAKR